MISFCQKQSRELLITQHYNNLVVTSPPRPLVGLFKTCPRCSACSLVVYARKKVPVRTPPPQHIAKKNVSVECQFLKRNSG